MTTPDWVFSRAIHLMDELDGEFFQRALFRIGCDARGEETLRMGGNYPILRFLDNGLPDP